MLVLVEIPFSKPSSNGFSKLAMKMTHVLPTIIDPISDTVDVKHKKFLKSL